MQSLGFFLGAGITYVIMGCIGSAVNTVIGKSEQIAQLQSTNNN